MRVESRNQRWNGFYNHNRLIAFWTLVMRLSFNLCYLTLFLFSVGTNQCSAFPIKKAVVEDVRQDSEKLTRITKLSSFPSCIGRLSTPVSTENVVKRGSNNNTTIVNYYVIGTSHFRCNSYREVSALIKEIRPDGVVIELDPERLLRLTLDDAITATRNALLKTEDRVGNRWFGGDFLSAIETSRQMDIPLFLGDEYPIETRQRFMDTLFDTDSYAADKLIIAIRSFFRPRRINSNYDSVDITGTFLEDPQKLLPLVATLSLPFLSVLFTLFLDVTGPKTSSHYETLASLLALLASYIASCKVYNNLIADRDVVLASNIQRAAKTITSLKCNQLIRKRWTFPVNGNEYEGALQQQSTEPDKTAIPLFTLKNPLEQNAIRNLSLFEPRWLKMIDRLLLSEMQQDSKNERADSDNQTSTPFSTNSRVIGCVTCTNKFYSALNVADPSRTNNQSAFIEGRYADVIFRRNGRFGELTDVREGSRPSGARKVRAKIFGKEAFKLSSPKDENGSDQISVVPEGYLTASCLRPVAEDEVVDAIDVESTPDEIHIVVVVGLLHANGVLDRLSIGHGKHTD